MRRSIADRGALAGRAKGPAGRRTRARRPRAAAGRGVVGPARDRRERRRIFLVSRPSLLVTSRKKVR